MDINLKVLVYFGGILVLWYIVIVVSVRFYVEYWSYFKLFESMVEFVGRR